MMNIHGNLADHSGFGSEFECGENPFLDGYGQPQPFNRLEASDFALGG